MMVLHNIDDIRAVIVHKNITSTVSILNSDVGDFRTIFPSNNIRYGKKNYIF